MSQESKRIIKLVVGKNRVKQERTKEGINQIQESEGVFLSQINMQLTYTVISTSLKTLQYLKPITVVHKMS